MLCVSTMLSEPFTKYAVFILANIVQIVPLTRVIVYCISLISVNKVVKTRHEVIKYLTGVNYRDEMALLVKC